MSKSATRRPSFGAALGITLVLCGWPGGLSAAGPGQRPHQRPNVVFILADDLGWSDTTLYGTTRFFETPNIERLARRGMTFRNAYAAYPVCSPTRASILSGQYPCRLGIVEANCQSEKAILEPSVNKHAPPWQKSTSVTGVTRLRTDYYTLGKAFHDAGYATGHFGKWHCGLEPYDPLHHGFDVDVPHAPFAHGPLGHYLAPWPILEKRCNFHGLPGENLEDRMAREAVAFLKAHKDHPFFLNYWAFSVHGEFEGKPHLVEKYRKKALAVGGPTPHPVYAAMVETLDDAVGTLLDALDELRLADNTIVVFFSDNGGAEEGGIKGERVRITSNSPLRGGKATIYEGGTREPLVVAWPGVTRPGSRSDALFDSVDFYPTLLELTGIPKRAGAAPDGVSQVPALREKGQPRDTAFCHVPVHANATLLVPSTSLRKGDWKLIRFWYEGPGGADRYELYDLKTDVGEAKNLAAAEPDRVRRLSALMDQCLKDTHALLPARNSRYDPRAVPPPVK